jgi:hypothetical protein
VAKQRKRKYQGAKKPTKKAGDGKGPGRPTRKTPEIVEIILECLRAGLHVETTCGYAKIDKGSYYRWLESDKDFSTQVAFARSEAIISLSEQVKREDPKFILKNLAPKLYRDKIETEHSSTEPFKVIIEDYTDE